MKTDSNTSVRGLADISIRARFFFHSVKVSKRLSFRHVTVDLLVLFSSRESHLSELIAFSNLCGQDGRSERKKFPFVCVHTRALGPNN